MPNPAPPTPPARTHAQATLMLRRPFAPGAIGFRAMTKVALNDNPYGGAQVAAFLNAQSVTQRLNTVCPGAWRMDFAPAPSDLLGPAAKKLYLACRLTITLPDSDGAQPTDAVYSDIGELDSGSFAGLKALYSDARKRVAVAAGVGAYLYTALAPVILPIGPGAREVQAVRRSGKGDLLVLSAETEQWLRHGYQVRMNTAVVRRDLGEILGHGEPGIGMGQDDATETTVVAADNRELQAPGAATAGDANRGLSGEVVAVDFAALAPGEPNGSSGPAAA